MALTYILTLIKKFASIQINPNRLVNFSAVFAIVLFLPLFFSTLAQPPAGNSSTLELLPLLTKPDRRKDAWVHPAKSSVMVADSWSYLLPCPPFKAAHRWLNRCSHWSGHPGVTALRLALGTLILVAVFKPWRLRFSKEQRRAAAVVWSVARGDELSLLPIHPDASRSAMAVALEFTGPLAVALFGSRRPVDFIWVALAVLGLMVPVCRWGRTWLQVDLTGAAAGPRRRGLLGGLYSDRAACRRRTWSGHGSDGVAHRGSLVFVPFGMAQATAIRCGSGRCCRWAWRIAILSTALPYSLEMMALTRLPTRTFGTLMSLEPALAALSGMVFLGETLKLYPDAWRSARSLSPRWAPR